MTHLDERGARHHRSAGTITADDHSRRASGRDSSTLRRLFRPKLGRYILIEQQGTKGCVPHCVMKRHPEIRNEYPAEASVGAPPPSFLGALMNCRTAVPMMLAAIALSACGGSEDEKGGDESGIYQLEMVTEYDTCTPKRVTGDLGQVQLTHETDGYYIFYSRNDEGDFVGGLYGAEVPNDRPTEQEYGPMLDCPETRRWMSLELMSDLGPIEVRYKERYSNLASCELPSPNRPVGMPDSDCEASILLRYSLVRMCAEPCVISIDLSPENPSETLVCDCTRFKP